MITGTSALSLGYSAGLDPVFYFVPKDYDISASTGQLIIRKDGVSLHNSSAGITVVDIELIKDLEWRDGTIIVAGTVVKALRVAPDLSGVDPPLPDPNNWIRKKYSYGIYVDDAWGIQGQLTVWPDTGNVLCHPSISGVDCGPVQVAVDIIGVTVGASGTSGFVYRLIDSNDTITASDQFVEIVAGGGDISVSLPLAGDIFISGKSLQISVFRPGDDTGNVEITGLGSELIDAALWPGESIIIYSNGTDLLIG